MTAVEVVVSMEAVREEAVLHGVAQTPEVVLVAVES